jgi:hypothetical protein
MELITVKQDDIEAVRVVLTIQALPTYVENMVMDRLTRKLSQEFGPPPERKPEKRPPAEAANPDGDDPPAAADRGKRIAPKQSRDAERPGAGAREEAD